MRHGYTIVWCGWQHDVPAVDGLMRIHVPEARSADGPTPIVLAVVQIGNERSGSRLLDLSVPVATYTGWNLRHADMGAPDQLMSLLGATIPFPVRREAREAGGDPQLSIEEHYPTKAEYLAQVRRAAQALVADGYLLAEDLELVVSQASQRYELVLRHVEKPLLTGN